MPPAHLERLWPTRAVGQPRPSPRRPRMPTCCACDPRYRLDFGHYGSGAITSGKTSRSPPDPTVGLSRVDCGPSRGKSETAEGCSGADARGSASREIETNWLKWPFCPPLPGSDCDAPACGTFEPFGPKNIDAILNTARPCLPESSSPPSSRCVQFIGLPRRPGSVFSRL